MVRRRLSVGTGVELMGRRLSVGGKCRVDEERAVSGRVLGWWGHNTMLGQLNSTVLGQ